MEERKIYEKPELIIDGIVEQNVITTSTDPSTGGGGGIVLPDDEW